MSSVNGRGWTGSETFSGTGSTRRRRRSPGRTPDLGRTETRGPGRRTATKTNAYLSFGYGPVHGLVHVPFDFERLPGERHHGLHVQARLFRADAVQDLVQHLLVQLVDLKHTSRAAVYARRSGGIGPLATLPAEPARSRRCQRNRSDHNGATTRIPTVMDCNCVSRLVRISSFFTPRKLKCLAGALFDFIVSGGRRVRVGISADGRARADTTLAGEK